MVSKGPISKVSVFPFKVFTKICVGTGKGMGFNDEICRVESLEVVVMGVGMADIAKTVPTVC